jgi:hypothetical protein
VEEEEEASIIILCLFKVLGQCSILATWSSCLADPGMETPISSIPKFSFSLPPSNPTAELLLLLLLLGGRKIVACKLLMAAIIRRSSGHSLLHWVVVLLLLEKKEGRKEGRKKGRDFYFLFILFDWVSSTDKNEIKNWGFGVQFFGVLLH